jgi:hypothetical protein
VNLGEALRTRDGSGGPQETIGYSIKRRLLGPPMVNEQLRVERLSRPLALGVAPAWAGRRERAGLHAEPGAPYSVGRCAGPAHLDLCRARPAEEVQQQFPRRPGDAGRGLPPAGPDGPARARPLKLKTRTTQPPGEKPGRAADVAPQGLVHAPPERPGTTAVGPAQVLVVDEELVQARQPAHPAEAEEAGRRPGPQRPDEQAEVPACERALPLLRQAAPGAGQDQPGASQRVALAQHQMRGQIAGRPRRKQGRRPGAEITEQGQRWNPGGGGSAGYHRSA